MEPWEPRPPMRGFFFSCVGFGRRPVHVISANERRTADKHPASSPDGLVVFQTYTNLINSERETLWARHNALVLANSLIIGALAISPARNAALKGRRAQ